jgi:hypothetical protein
VVESSGSSDNLMLGAGLIALMALLTAGTGEALRRRSTSNRS